jgi:hypothetical protein
MVRSREAVQEVVNRTAYLAGWLGYVIALITITIVHVMSPPLWVSFLIGLAAGLLWVWLEKRLTQKAVADLYK